MWSDTLLRRRSMGSEGDVTGDLVGSVYYTCIGVEQMLH